MSTPVRRSSSASCSSTSGDDYIVTVRYGQAAPLKDVRAELEQHPDVLRHGPGAVLQAALLHAVQAYTPVVDGLENDVREVERDVFSESRGQPTRRIYFLIREVIDFLIALEPLPPAIKRLTGPECIPWVEPEIVPLFRDVEEALSRILERGRSRHSAARPTPSPPATPRRRCVRTRTRGGFRHGSPSAWSRPSSAGCSG